MDSDETARAAQAIREIVDREGYEVFRLSVGPDGTITLVLDADSERVTLDDCIFMNKRIRWALSNAGLDADDCAINVESPGTDRALLTSRHFERFVEKRIKLKLKEPRDGVSYFEGRILGVEEGIIRFEAARGQAFEFTVKDVNSAHLHPEMPF